MMRALLRWLGIASAAEVQALRDDVAAVWRDAAPNGALPLYMCPVCHQCLTAAAFRAHLPDNHPPGAADYHRQHGLNMQEGHLQGGLLDYRTGEFQPRPQWHREPVADPTPPPDMPSGGNGATMPEESAE